MKKIKGIKLTFENCEEVFIEDKYIGIMKLDKFKRKISRFNKQGISDDVIVGEFALQISKDVEVVKQESLYKNKTIFKRIQLYDDITQIDIEYENGDVEEFRIKWEGHQNNDYQSSKVGSDGHLYVLCKKNETVYEYFHKYIDGYYNYSWI